MTITEILDQIGENKPFAELSGISVLGLEKHPKASDAQFDVKFTLQFGQNQLQVYGEVKNECTPKSVQQLVPWLARMKAFQTGTAFALICPYLSPEAQAIYAENNVDFIDLAGNISINVPGKAWIRRSTPKGTKPPTQTFQNPFIGKSSRVIRVLLEGRKEWTVTGIEKELELLESTNSLGIAGFPISVASVSKALRGLEEELLIRRQGSGVWIPE